MRFAFVFRIFIARRMSLAVTRRHWRTAPQLADLRRADADRAGRHLKFRNRRTLCVFACGRVATPVVASFAFIVARFCSSLSRSTHNAGVSSSHLETPTPGNLSSAAIVRISAAVWPLAFVGIQTVTAPAPAVWRNPRREMLRDVMPTLSARRSGKSNGS